MTDPMWFTTTMHRRHFVKGLVGAGVGLTTGCRRAHPTLTSSDEERQLVVSKNIDIDVYLDASVPIRGFLTNDTNGQKNYFQEFLDKSNGILTGAFSKATVTYWRFGGGEPRKISSIRDFLTSHQQFSEKETRIDKAITAKNESSNRRAKLKIIVTDMFQNDNDVDRLATELNERYLQSENSAIGVAGVRNPFYGEIDDLPGSVPAGAADSLPIYFLIAGLAPDVRLAMRVILERIGASAAPVNNIFSLVYSSRIGPAFQRPLNLIPIDKMHAGYSEWPSRIQGASEKGIPYIEIKQKDVLVAFKDTGKDSALLLGPYFRLSPEVKVVVKSWSSTQNGVDDRSSVKAFAINPVRSALTIRGSMLRKGCVYLCQFELAADRADFSQLKPWYLEIDEVPKIRKEKQFEATNDGQHHPGKTPNLRHFLQTMSDKMFQSDVKIGRYQVFVGVK